MDVLKTHIKEAIDVNSIEKSPEAVEWDERIEVKRLYKTTKFLHYVMKFVIRSRILFSALNANSNVEEFEEKLQGMQKICF